MLLHCTLAAAAEPNAAVTTQPHTVKQARSVGWTCVLVQILPTRHFVIPG